MRRIHLDLGAGVPVSAYIDLVPVNIDNKAFQVYTITVLDINMHREEFNCLSLGMARTQAITKMRKLEQSGWELLWASF